MHHRLNRSLQQLLGPRFNTACSQIDGLKQFLVSHPQVIAPYFPSPLLRSLNHNRPLRQHFDVIVSEAPATKGKATIASVKLR